MAGQKTFFLTGANAKIKVNNTTIAFCTNINYNVTVNHAAPVLLGMYESSSIEPLSYLVSGSFSIIRYTAGMLNDAKPNIKGITVKDSGNGIGAWGPSSQKDKIKSGLKLSAKGSISSAADGRAYDSLNPSKLESSTVFDIEIHQKYGDGNKMHAVAKIRDCRILSSSFSLSKTSAAVQTYTFRAIYLDEDSYLADFSGLGQQFL